MARMSWHEERAFSLIDLLVVVLVLGILVAVAVPLLLNDQDTVDEPGTKQQPLASTEKCSLKSGGNEKPEPGCVYARAVLADGPLAYWRLSDSGGNAVDVAGVTRATYQGGVGQQVSALTPADPDPAANFDADDDYVSVTGSGSLNFSGDFTIEAWVEAESLQNAFVASKYNEAYYLWLYDDGTIEAGYRERGAYEYVAARGGSYSVGETVYVVGAREGNDVRLYVNGSEVASASGSLEQEVNFESFFIGTGAQDGFAIGEDDSWPDGLFFDGTLDEVAVYDYALEPRQIADHYSVGEGS